MAVSPSTLRRNREALPLRKVMVLMRIGWSYVLYTFTCLVTVPMVTNTVSKATVSVENFNCTASVSNMSSFTQEGLSQSVDKITIVQPNMWKNVFTLAGCFTIFTILLRF